MKKEIPMKRWMDLRSVLLAGAFFALGFLLADRMTPAGAAPLPSPQDSNGAAFSGTDGAVVLRNQIYVIRGGRIYRLDPSTGGTQRHWGEFAP
jgi:hypothetical protein